MPQEEHYGSQAMQVEGQPLDLHGDREIQAYALIKDRVFVHTQAFNSELLESIGMDVNFANVWHTIGWNDFMPISEEGSHLLTIQFLCTLQEADDGISFHFFRREYQLFWMNLSLLLGFHRKCIVDFDKAVRDFNCQSFWTSISDQVVVGKFAPRCTDIHNPTLRLMHKWLALSIFPREDVRLVHNDELKILYAMVKKIRVSPVKPMIA